MNALDEKRAPKDDTFKILIATDTHLGYAENDPEIGEDSFNSFEEILDLANKNDVDFILLGGDLFHDNKPSTQCLYRCMALLKKYCMGERPISVEFLSDQDANFQHCFQRLVNYEDPNLNISIPVFSIHGNHDDPSGSTQLCSLDLLSVTGLVNYFGKWTDLNDIKISPLLLRKGSSKLAIYGLSHIKDERLSRLFRAGHVQFYQPSEHTEEWFNIFVCHQNRADRGVTKYIPEEKIPNLMNLVVWGHEHECRLREEWSAVNELYITQPGSSVVTSLCEGESKEKFVGLLHVHKKEFKLVPLKLKTVRPFVFETIVLSQCDIGGMDHDPANNVQRYLTERVNFLIASAQHQETGHPKQPTLPLVRVRVEYNDELQCFNAIRFGQQFQCRVANPTDLIKQTKEKSKERKPREKFEDKANMEDFLQNEEVEDLWEVKMNAIITKYFDEVPTAKSLQVLSVKGISEAAARFIDKADKEAVERIIQHQRKKVQKHLLDENISLEKLDEAIEQYRLKRTQNPTIEAEENKKIFDDEIRAPPLEPTAAANAQMNISDDDSDEFTSTAQPATTSRGRARGGRGRAATTRAPSARGRARGSRARGSTTVTQTVTTMLQNSQKATRSSTSKNQNSKLSRLKFDDSDSD